MQIQPPPEKFLSTLLEIRDYYAPLVEKYGQLYREALDNLTHVEALLSNWSLQEEVGSNGITAPASEEIRVLSSSQKNLNGSRTDALKTEAQVGSAANTELPQVNQTASENVSSQSTEDIDLPLEQIQSAAGVVENLSNGSSLDVSPNETESDESANAPQPPALNSEVTVSQESDTFDKQLYFVHELTKVFFRSDPHHRVKN